MATVRGETYECKIYPRIQNSAFEYEEAPSIIFKCRPATNYEKKNYRLLQGVEGNETSNYLIASNIPTSIQPKDKVVFQNKEWIVESTGYYYEQTRIVNASVMRPEYISRKCPKGIVLR